MTGDRDFDPIRALSVLLDHQVRFVMIGGFAASLRRSPVMTGDLDVCYDRDPKNLRRLVAALREMNAELRGVDEAVPFILDERSLSLGDSFTFATDFGPLDILATPSGTRGFDDLVQAAEPMEVHGLFPLVASLDDLMRMKLASGRPKDLIHAEWLAAVKREMERLEREGDEPPH
jgi:hypothetical protein